MKRVLAIATLLVVGGAVSAATAEQPSNKGSKKPPKEPANLSLSAAPNPVKFGRSLSLSGKLSGPNADGRTVTLREDPFPFDALVNVDSTSSDAQGNYGFVRSPAANTRYQARQGGVESEIVTVAVTPRVSLRLSDRTPAAGKRVRFSGRLCPEHDGGSLEIQRRTAPKQWRTVARATLVDAGSCSSYARRRRVRRDGVFRTFFAAHDDHAAGGSRARRIDVH
jgi:hypothetical protein